MIGLKDTVPQTNQNDDLDNKSKVQATTKTYLGKRQLKLADNDPEFGVMNQKQHIRKPDAGFETNIMNSKVDISNSIHLKPSSNIYLPDTNNCSSTNMSAFESQKNASPIKDDQNDT